MQLVLVRLLAADPQMQIVGQARDGEEALKLAETLQPDVITLDVEMPKLSGLEVLEQLLPRHPIPVVMLSSLTHRGAQTTIKALELGAVDFVGKPGSAGVPDLETVQKQLLYKIRLAALESKRYEPGRLLQSSLPPLRAAPAHWIFCCQPCRRTCPPLLPSPSMCPRISPRFSLND